MEIISRFLNVDRLLTETDILIKIACYLSSKTVNI